MVREPESGCPPFSNRASFDYKASLISKTKIFSSDTMRHESVLDHGAKLLVL